MKNVLNKYHSKIDKISLYIFVYCIMVKVLIHALYFVKSEIVFVLLVIFIPFILITKRTINYLNDEIEIYSCKVKSS